MKNKNKLWLIILLPIALCWACNSDKKKQRAKHNSLFELLQPEKTGIYFRNDVKETDSFNALSYSYIYNGGGVAAGDLNNDGLVDLIFVSNQKGPSVYINKGDFQFENITTKCGLTDTLGWYTGVIFADINADGWLDIYICKSGNVPDKTRQNKCYINNHNLTFKECSEELGLNDGNPTTQSLFFDFDKDGDLDCFIVNHPDNFEFIFNTNAFMDSAILPTGSDRLYENRDGKFYDITSTAGLQNTYGYGLSASLSDINHDGYEDIFIANDYVSNDQLFVSTGKGTFKEATSSYFSQTSLFSMGSDFGDLNNDGLADLICVDMRPDNHYRLKNNLVFFPNEYYYTFISSFLPVQNIKNVVQLATDTGTYQECAQIMGLDKTDWSWSALIQDFDNDGWNDIHITNGTKRDLHDLDFLFLTDAVDHPEGFAHETAALYKKMPRTLLPDYAFINKQGLKFEDVSDKWGISTPSVSSGAAYADLDNDGDMDLVVNNTDTFAFVFKNNLAHTDSTSFLQLKLQGAAKNTFGIGTKVVLHSNGNLQTQTLQNSRGFQSCSQAILHFGTGMLNKIDSIEVFWPNNNYTLLQNVKTDTLLVVSEINSAPVNNNIAPAPTGSKILTQKQGLPYKHSERPFNDFKNERLLPYQLSKEGPGLAVGDINNDGLEDLLITNGAGAAPQLNLQKPDGNFVPANKQPWSDWTDIETIGAAFFDADADGDADLYLATGSNEYGVDDSLLADHLFLNNGKGNFTDATGRIPQKHSSSSCVVPFDFDQDGDIDLLIGGRGRPKQFPLPGKTMLLENKSGFFTDVTALIAPGLDTVGMVNCALFTDFNGDGKADIIVAGDWMPISFFANTGKTFTNVTPGTGLANEIGWWKSILAADFDSDGDMDYVAGNLGCNSFIKASAQEPVIVLYDDFDKNAVFEPLLFHYIKNDLGPFNERNTFCEQMPSFRNRFLTFKSYATYNWLPFINSEFKNARRYKATQLNSCFIENLGRGKFKLSLLPVQAQVAPVFGSIANDFNGDGFTDLLLQGNCRGNYFSEGQWDAGRGLLLSGNGTNKFSPLSYKVSGFYQPGEGRALSLINAGGKPVAVSTINSGRADLYSLRVDKVKYITLKKGEWYGYELFTGGRKQRVEFLNANGYLTAPGQTFFVSPAAVAVEIYGPNNKRVVTF